ncbi:hypothetical protein GCM10023157_13290 [Gluconacetobacter asukensis]
MQAGPETPILRRMWTEPYLETCCRSALHRLMLSGAAGRPAGLKDQPCLERLARMGLATQDAGGRYHSTPQGTARHESEILSPS